ncbi:MAG: c-type cytochrome [Phycisphaerales bacterium]|nr:c-type cytochrome [Phycisphaerales bacterium]
MTVQFEAGMTGRTGPAGRDGSQPDCQRDGEGLSGIGLALLAAAAMCVPFFGIGAKVSHDAWWAIESVRLEKEEAARAWQRVVEAPALAMVPVDRAAHGRDVFLSACILCHGADGRGVDGLGRNLAESPFVAAQGDEDLFKFITVGRPDAKPVAMPPRAGRTDLADADLRDVVTFLRGLQDPRRMPRLPEPVALASPAPTEQDKAKALAAAGGDAELAGYIAHGTTIFNSTCIACHGAGGLGIAGNGKMLKNNEFVRSLDDDGLLAFLKKGRDPSDPKNTTGVGMPPKGGNPALSEDDLLDVISYVRTLQDKKTAAK